MIASLTGRVLSTSSGQLVIDVSGVGFLVHTTSNASSEVTVGQDISVFTSLVVREDAFTLYGFLEKTQQDLFELLRSVNGVGPKSALAILGELSVDQISSAVASESDATFKAVTGIGAKTAKLITLTLAGKITAPSGTMADSESSEEAVAALIGLGWSERQSREAISRSATAGMSNQEVLKAALKLLAKARKP